MLMAGKIVPACGLLEFAYQEATMNQTGVAAGAGPADPDPTFRPYRSLSPELFDQWLDSGLQCTAGKREFKLGRYFLTRFCSGAEFLEGLSLFRREVAAYRKVGFLSLCVYDESCCNCVEDELWRLGKAMYEAGLAESDAAVINGQTVATPIEVTCPVTGLLQPTSSFPSRSAGTPTIPATRFTTPHSARPSLPSTPLRTLSRSLCWSGISPCAPGVASPMRSPTP